MELIRPNKNCQAHPGVSKPDRKSLCRLIDSRKLSPEASFHAASNDRLPVRAVIQVLFSEQAMINKQIDWSGSFSGMRSPSTGIATPGPVDRLRDCWRKREGFSAGRRLDLPSFKNNNNKFADGEGEVEFSGFVRRTPAVDMKNRVVKGKTPLRWRKSVS
ncbi:OLC1v1013554C1 [Oldenlandia corymbosa var. corymbosa]|uniref:OLC1v1013554C1 n=1 Tax=Oldenlandia corymbosa var. corymbosa TaxID=529605 RepID=A0AAV1DYT9_OLDCO|nr:OLC1v1013554C1 [Oldenlandia corymbosa var. corymbosa]